MIATMAATFHKYFSTRNTILPAPSPSSPDTLVPRGPWSRNTKTWPTTILLTTSTLSFLVSLGVMAAYLHGGVRAANTTSEYGSYVGALTFLMHLGLWIAVAAAYRAGKDGDDLWGWTCDERADRIQNAFEGVIVFRRYCDIQTSSWVVSCAQVGVVALWALVYAWGWRRLAGQREMGRRFGGRGEGEAERGLRYVHRESWITKWVPTRR